MGPKQVSSCSVWVQTDTVQKTDTIEKFFNGAWTILPVKLGVPSARIGAICRDNKTVLLFGGIGNQNAMLKNVWAFNELKLDSLPPLDRPCSFEYSVFIMSKTHIHALERTGDPISYRLS